MILPELLDANLHPVRRIQPIKASVRLNLTPLSTAELDLYPGETIPARSLVAMYTVQGFAGVYRSSTPNETYGNRATRVHLEHAVAEIGDWIVGAEVEETITTAASAISSLFASYGGTLWSLGTLNCSVNVRFSASKGQNVLEAILGIVSQVPGYMLTLDQTVTPWQIGIALQPETVTAEGRLSRNMTSVQITYDESELCNKVYISGIDTPFEAYDSQATYGVIEHYISENDLPTATAQMVALAYLQAHCDPAISVSISMLDLANVTGETLDRITLGAKFRLALPEDGVSIEQHVIGIQFDDVYGNPEAITVTLANEISDTVAYLKKQRRSGRASQRKVEKVAEDVVQQYQHWTTENEVYRESVYKIIGVTYDENGNVIYQTDPVTGEIIYDEAGNPIPVYDETSNGSITGRVLQTAQNYTSLYQMTLNAPEFDPTVTYPIGSMVMHEGTVYKFTANHTGDWTGLDVVVVPPLQSQITQNAQEISQKVSQGALSGYLTITAAQTKLGNVIEWSDGSIKAAQIITAINEQTGQTQVKIEADQIDLAGYVTADEIFATDATIGQYLKADNLIVTTKIKTAALQATNGAIIESGLEVSDGAVIGGGLIADAISIGTSSSNTPLGNVVTGFGTVTPDPTTGVVTIPYSTFQYPTAGDNNQNINFNIADMAYFRNHVGIQTATLYAYSDDPLDWADWTKDAAGTLVNKYGLFEVTTKEDPAGHYYIGIDASSGTGGSASIDDISGTALTPDQILYQTIPIKASGTNVSDYTENATLTNTTYTDNSTTYPCVTLTMDSIVIGRISTQATYDNGKLIGQNTTRVSKGTWSNGSIVFTTNAPNPAANVPVTLLLTHYIGSTWTWTSVDDSGEYQLTAQIKDGNTVVATDNITLPDTKVIVTSPGTQQSSWWKTSGTNAYKYVVPAPSASDYLTTDTNNEHLLATGNGTQTVIDPTEAVDRGFSICHDSIGLSETTQTIPSGQSVTIYPTAKASATASSATNITSAGITLTAEAATVVDPKVSKGTWQNGSITFTAGTAGDDTSTLKLYTSGAYSGTLDNVQSPTKVSFSILEDTGSGTTAATGATIFANISTTTGTLKLSSFDETNNRFAVSLDTKPSVNIGGSSAIQPGVTQKYIDVAKGTAQPNTPTWNESAHTYTITADGSFMVGSQQINQTQGSITGGFAPEAAINYGKNLAKGIASVTASQTNATAYGQAAYDEIPVESNGYYIITATPNMGNAVHKKFHAPASGGGGGGDRWARYLNPITLDAADIDTVTKTSFATYSDSTTETDENKLTSVQIDARAVYQAGVTAGMGGVVNVLQDGWNYGSNRFYPSAGNGSDIRVQLSVVPVMPGSISEATSNAQFVIHDNISNTDITGKHTFYLSRSSDGSMAYLKTNQYLPSNNNVIAKIAQNGVPGEDPRLVQSLTNIKLTAADIATSMKTTKATFDSGDPQEGINISVDATDVYTKGVADGSKMTVEKPHIEPNALTQNNKTYTIFPSSGFNVMSAAQFRVEVPTYEGIASASIDAERDDLPAWWSKELGQGTLSKKYGQIKVVGNDNVPKFYVVDASNVYQAGVTAGANYNIESLTTITDKITSNGTKTLYPSSGHDATEGIKFTVDVKPNLGTKTLEDNNKTYYASTYGYDGFSSVTVKVDSKIPVTAIECSETVKSIGTNRGDRANAGSISKSGLTANSYLGFTISVKGTPRKFYIAVNP